MTDPPYNVDYEGKTKDKLKIENDKKDDAAFGIYSTPTARAKTSARRRANSWAK